MTDEPSISLLSEQRARWGEAVDPGLMIAPDILLKQQQRIPLTPLELNVVLHLMAEWDEPGELPAPRLSVLAKRMRTSKRTVERTVQSLARSGLLERRPGEARRGQTVRGFDLSGLQRRLQELARQEVRSRPSLAKAS